MKHKTKTFHAMKGKHALIKIPVNLLFLKMQSLNNSRKGQVDGGFFKIKLI